MQDNVIIRKANMNEIDKVMCFLKENWGKNHVMANSKELMCYEHAWNDEFTFVLAEDSNTKELYGVCGYIPYSSGEQRDMGGGIWKVIQNPHFMLGVDLFRYIQSNTGCRLFADCGANPKTKGHRKLAGHMNAKLNQYYRLNPVVDTFLVAVIKEKRLLKRKNNLSYELIDLETIEQFKKSFDVTQYKEIKPYKDNKYIEHRYYKHIKYHYRIMGISDGKKIGAIVIGRSVTANGKKIFRIVDFLGNEAYFAGTYGAWDNFLFMEGYEYIDFYEYGLKHENLTNAGFVLRDDEVNIIPNYFEPFEQRNIEIHISANMKEGVRMFKGDGDQDRPNSL